MGYPITLQLRGRRVLVVGGGPVAHRRVCRVLADGARVTVVAPSLTPELADLADAGALEWRAENYHRSHLTSGERIWLVHTATGLPAVDRAVADDAETTGIWCVRADSGAHSAAWSPAVADGAASTSAEGLQVAVTGDRDPRRARAVRDAILAGLRFGALPVRRRRRPSPSDSETAGGSVVLVGGGPGDPRLLTLRGWAALMDADVVVADRLGPRSVLDQLPADVEVIDVGKEPGRHRVTQDGINALLVEHARAGKRVVRLKGGDPFVLGRGGEEALACREHGIPVEVVPGVSSAVAVPAAAGIPVTHRGVTSSVVVLSGHEGADATTALTAAPSDATIVLLMGVATIAATVAQVLAAGRAPDTPVAFVESGWTPQQRATVTTLEKAVWVAEHEGVRAPAVVVIGAVVGLRDRLGDLVGVRV